ncbi:peptidylprolyl isomerase [Anaerorhabdus sp.]|uniref:peptidylprolyl isomerase n=1 Tax=Anaerorhabdus sp. TaxID=1872524 RepID=UPI002B218581|nr:peptidylprolyl isomerase [Anaerorhabdus sp.]MEA4874152.1 peptidylprolyl isomerase [Anaerorhabdus sp.]
MKDMFKKYGVVMLVSCFFIAIIAYFAIDQSKDVIPGKQVNGEDIVFTIDDKSITTNEFYDKLYNDLGIQSVYQAFEKAVVNASVETTDEMKALAKETANGIISNFQSQYGATYEAELTKILKSLGYNDSKDLEAYLIQGEKRNQLLKQYILDNKDTVYTPYEAEYKPRTASHILIQMVDANNPTDEEKAKMAEVDAALAEGKTFAEVATTYSDDTGSAVNGGSLGFMDSTTQFVPEFLAAALALNEGERSEWVKSDYGYHLIQIDSTNFDTFKDDDAFYNQFLTIYPEIQSQVIWAKAQELGVDFAGNDELKAQLLDFMGISE